jgi:hypothetical protein
MGADDPKPMNRAEVLAIYGILDGPDLAVDLIKEGGALWRVAIRAAGNPLKALVPSEAKELADKLRDIGETQLADRFAQEAEKARRYQRGDAAS